jgi:hypothetical protein
LNAEDRHLLRAIDAAVLTLAQASACAPNAGLSAALTSEGEGFQTLRHPLSDFFLPTVSAFTQCTRSMMEWSALKANFEALSTVLSHGQAEPFMRAICAVASATKGAKSLRSQGVRTSADSRGQVVRFPPSDILEMRLAYIVAMLWRARGESPAFSAIVALVSLTHCHPFADGNGRSARVLFNALLQRRLARPRFYLPLYELAQLSAGGYLVRVRQAELRREWTPLFAFILAAVELWTKTVSNVPSPDSRQLPSRPGTDCSRCGATSGGAARANA